MSLKLNPGRLIATPEVADKLHGQRLTESKGNPKNYGVVLNV